MNLERYIKNLNSFSKEEIEDIYMKKVCIVGCGGLGGYTSQILARFGVGHITVVDGDVFVESNLNRQLFATEKTIGKYKVEVCKSVLEEINSSINIKTFNCMVSEVNVNDIIKNHDIVIDCLDNIETRLLLEKACYEENIPLVHGAIAGFFGQVTTIYPGDKTLEKIYKNKNKGIESKWGNPSFIPPTIASIQCCEAIKVLVGKGEVFRNKLLYVDLLNNDFEMIEIS